MARRTKSGPDGFAAGKGNSKPRAVAPGPQEVEVWPGVSCTVKRTPDGLLEVCFFDDREMGKKKAPPLELNSSPGIGSTVVNKRGFLSPFPIQPNGIVCLMGRQGLLQTVQVVSS